MYPNRPVAFRTSRKERQLSELHLKHPSPGERSGLMLRRRRVILAGNTVTVISLDFTGSP